ncbi:MAG: osmoprotectant transport system substrate-binding protein [Gaiellaceae bacterium]|nr:osmoprotectant transport system substrate-binding protein [Gaiellaceae bacterium]
MRSLIRHRGCAVIAAICLVIGLAACGSSKKSTSSGSSGSAPAGQPGKGKPAVTLGDKNFTEQYILGELYSQALKAKGFTVNLKKSIGSSEVTDKALTSGKIDLYPEYTGVIVAELAHRSPDQRPRSADQTYQQAKAFENKRGFELLDKTPFVDADVLAVLPAYAQSHGNLKSVSDLKKAGSFTMGGPPENKTRFEGVVGLTKVYGLTNLKFKPLTMGLPYDALDKKQIDVATVFTTDGQLLQKGKYVLLSDPQNIFGFQNVAPVVSKKVLAAEGPAFSATLNAVSAKLTTQAIQQMNAAAVNDKQDPSSIAKAFLRANGLL